MATKSKIIYISEELFDSIGRITVQHNISGNGFIILAIESFMKKNCKPIYKEYTKKKRNQNKSPFDI